MSYQNAGQRPYASYSASNNPYAASEQQQQQQPPYPTQGSSQQPAGYGRPGGYGQPNGMPARPTNPYAAREANNYEMGQMNGAQQDPNAILNTCSEIGRGIDSIDNALGQLRSLHARALRETGDTSATDSEIQNLSRETVTSYQNLVGRVKKLQADPESGKERNSAQVRRVHGRLKNAIQQFQQVEAEHRQARREQMERAIRIARPDATDAEVQQAAEDPQGGQVFANALMDRDRRGQAQSALAANQQRHQAIQEIEREMVQLAQLFQDLDTMVVQQEAAVSNIEQQGEQVQDNLNGANVQIDSAIGSAQAARRKKFWCLGISIVIIIIIAVVIAVVVVVMNRNNSSGNSSNNSPAPAQSQSSSEEKRSVVAAAKVEDVRDLQDRSGLVRPPKPWW